MGDEMVEEEKFKVMVNMKGVRGWPSTDAK